MIKPLHGRKLAQPLRAKYTDLVERISAAGSALVAFSGGVDSALVAGLAHQALGERALAITADSPAVPRLQLQEARNFARALGLRHRVIGTSEVEDPGYQRNAANRCFYCKSELYGKLLKLARQQGLAVVFDGTNADDRGDHRPGMAAAFQLGVRSPLLEAGLGKDEVRELSRRAGLPTWDKPASACLASRVAYGIRVTPEILGRIEVGEDALRALGFRQFRVRHHGLLVRIEVAPDELPRALEPRMAARFVSVFKELGYQFVSLDLEGYRSGSLNAALAEKP
ncbi:MAG: ATP-dependent sacrificial sulfur transferase LarE [Acidobacteriota bacterium]